MSTTDTTEKEMAMIVYVYNRHGGERDGHDRVCLQQTRRRKGWQRSRTSTTDTAEKGMAKIAYVYNRHGGERDGNDDVRLQQTKRLMTTMLVLTWSPSGNSTKSGRAGRASTASFSRFTASSRVMGDTLCGKSPVSILRFELKVSHRC